MNAGAVSLHFKGDDFFIHENDLDPQFAADLRACGGTGTADPAVTYVLETYTITGDPEDCSGYLYGYGAWDESELLNHAENLERLVWLAGGDLRDGHTIIFSNY